MGQVQFSLFNVFYSSNHITHSFKYYKMYSTAVPIQKEKMKLLKAQLAAKNNNSNMNAHKKQKHA